MDIYIRSAVRICAGAIFPIRAIPNFSHHKILGWHACLSVHRILYAKAPIFIPPHVNTNLKGKSPQYIPILDN